jgi:drug/metabolite transporter (DMT)-like permease
MGISTVHDLGVAERKSLKNAAFVLLIIFGNTFGNLLLAIGMNRMPPLFAVSFGRYLVAAFTDVALLAGTFLVTVSMFSQLYIYTWADLSYVLPVTASGYVLSAILGKYVLSEHVSISRWLGVGAITLGVLFVAPTPADTKHTGDLE